MNVDDQHFQSLSTADFDWGSRDFVFIRSGIDADFQAAACYDKFQFG